MNESHLDTIPPMRLPNSFYKPTQLTLLLAERYVLQFWPNDAFRNILAEQKIKNLFWPNAIKIIDTIQPVADSIKKIFNSASDRIIVLKKGAIRPILFAESHSNPLNSLFPLQTSASSFNNFLQLMLSGYDSYMRLTSHNFFKQ